MYKNIKICCQPCFDNFKTDIKMNITRTPVNEKGHSYICKSCNGVALIRDDFWDEVEFESEKIYIYPKYRH